jgi:hypothetical protein
MKNTILKSKHFLRFIYKNNKSHCLYFSDYQESKSHSKKHKTCQNHKRHHSYEKNRSNMYYFNGKYLYTTIQS